MFSHDFIVTVDGKCNVQVKAAVIPRTIWSIYSSIIWLLTPPGITWKVQSVNSTPWEDCFGIKDSGEEIYNSTQWRVLLILLTPHDKTQLKVYDQVSRWKDREKIIMYGDLNERCTECVRDSLGLILEFTDVSWEEEDWRRKTKCQRPNTIKIFN